MPQTPDQIRDEYIGSLNHIRQVVAKVQAVTGKHKALMFTDTHKIYSGLLLSAFSGFEYATRALFIYDVSVNTSHPLREYVRTVRGKTEGWYKLTEYYFTHPDSKSFYEWNYEKIVERAKSHLSTNHRFANLSNAVQFIIIRRVRNSIAHGSDKAKQDFMKSMREPPLSLTTDQSKGITPERFLASKRWGGAKLAILVAIDELEAAIRQLVP